jgi:hypothetical protein
MCVFDYVSICLPSYSVSFHGFDNLMLMPVSAYSELVSVALVILVYVALVIQHAKRMRHISVHCHLWPIRLYHIFPRYLTKKHNFRKTI